MAVRDRICFLTFFFFFLTTEPGCSLQNVMKDLDPLKQRQDPNAGPYPLKSRSAQIRIIGGSDLKSKIRHHPEGHSCMAPTEVPLPFFLTKSFIIT